MSYRPYNDPRDSPTAPAPSRDGHVCSGAVTGPVWAPDGTRVFQCQCGLRGTCRRPPALVETVVDGVLGSAAAVDDGEDL